MALFRTSAYKYMPDDSGEVFEESVIRTRTTAIWETTAFIFNDTSTVDGLHFKIQIPKNYVDTATLIIIWTSSVTTGTVHWDFSATAFGQDGVEDMDVATIDDTQASISDTAPGTAYYRMETSQSLTDGDYAVDDTVLCILARDGVNDTLSGTVQLEDVFFEYDDGT